MFIHPIYNHNWGNISTIYIYIKRLASNEIFPPSNKIHREVGRAKDLSAPPYVWMSCSGTFLSPAQRSWRQAATLTNGMEEGSNNSILGYTTIENITVFNAGTGGNVNFSLF